MTIKPPRLRTGDTIGLIAPCIGLKPDYIEKSAKELKKMGFQLKLSRHLFSESWGFSGSVEERVADLQEMVADPKVKMILFGGGEVCNQLLPYLDYDAITANPKIFCSYSDSTTLLNAIHCRTGLVTFYGASLRTFQNLSRYNWQSFVHRLMTTDCRYQKSAPWRTLWPGRCEGELAGGYLVNFAALQGLPWYPAPPEGCLLFLEDLKEFSTPAVVSKWMANLEHRGVLERASGLIFGHYADSPDPWIDEILCRIGQRWQIPVVQCEDYGHGLHNAILPIGIRARLDTEADSFELLESGVQ